MVYAFNQYATWPWRSYNLETLQQMFIDRQTRESCGYSATVTGTSKGYNTIVLNSVSDCVVPLTLPAGITQSSFSKVPGGTKFEQFGSDPVTMWVKLPGGKAVTLTLKTAIAY
jgi:hypothetical protein